MLERYHRELIRYFTRESGNADTAADVVQEAYARLLQLQLRGGVIAEPRALLYRAGRNLLINHAKRQANEQRMLGTLALVADGSVPPVEHQVDMRRRLERLVALLERMPRKRRDAFIAVRVYGMSYAETAAHMAISTKAVELHITRALLDCAGYGPDPR